MCEEPKDWKLKLRYGRLKTPFKHYTVFADGVVGQLEDGFECREGRAWMAMKVWASDASEAMYLIRAVGAQIGFTVDGRTEVYDTEPEQPPREDPFGYGIGFTPYAE